MDNISHMSNIAVYDRIGKKSETTHSADPHIVDGLIRHLSPIQVGTCLDVGCGTGNYTDALAKSGYSMIGIDISEALLAKAGEKNPEVQWCQGDARHLPLKSDSCS